eukprot:m.105176 g.105176  ORF g.105176 m.105176 type:complete len:331 (-) comp8911_c0_seq3:123-1115(-)
MAESFEGPRAQPAPPSALSFPAGVFPTMITPFHLDGSIDWPRVDALTEWYIANGCVGIFAVCQSSEMYELTADERLALAARVKMVAGDRAVVVASGTFPGPVEEQAVFVNRMGEVADAVVVLVNMMCAADENLAAWRANVQQLLALTGQTRLGLYECPTPYHRLLDPETLRWCALTGRFFFHKDTSRRPAAISAKLAALADLDTPFRFYNANAACLLPAIRLGAHGFSGVCANFYPQLAAWLCAHPAGPETDAVNDWLVVAEAVAQSKYPLSAKKFLAQFPQFLGTPYCRTASPPFNDEDDLRLASLLRGATALSTRLGLPMVPPAVQPG